MISLGHVNVGNEAEQHFEEYLRDRGIEFEYERLAGSRRPDYWLNRSSGLVVCEVKHVTAATSDLPNSSGAFDVHERLSKAVRRKSKQGRDLAIGTPYCVVLWTPNWPDDPFAMAGAAFGRPQIVMPFDSEAGKASVDGAYMTFGYDAVLREADRSHISAVCSIQQFNPGVRPAEDEIASLLDNGATREEGIAVISEVYERRAREGVFDRDERIPRLVTYHNPYANVPLGLDVFDGPHDEQFAEQDGEYSCSFRGEHIGELPR